MKLFVTDIDDTLSVGETVSGEVRRACERLRNAGWDIMIASGRTFGTAKEHIRATGATQPAILYDGSRVMSTEGKEIHSVLFDPLIAEKLLETLWDLPVEIQIAGDEVIHCRESDAETVRFYKKAGVPVYFVSNPVLPAPVYRIGLWIAGPEKVPSLKSQIDNQVRRIFGSVTEVTWGGKEFLDIQPKGVSKGAALERFVSALPERPELIVAAGDHDNDLTMLRYADVAAVPSKASPEALSCADVVMPPALEHGVSALAHWMLSPCFPPSRGARTEKRPRATAGPINLTLY